MNLISEIPAHLLSHLPIKEIVLQAGIAQNADSICHNLGKTLLICDENTKDFVTLKTKRIILPGTQKPELSLAKELAANSPDHFIAVGSGSLNDMVKYASFLAKKPYIIFATAPSMNGYASANVSLLVNGFKKSFLARPPEAIYLDLEILKNAPKRLINSGIGDSICRTTVQADILLSAQVKATPDYAELFTLLKKYEERIFDDVKALIKTLIFGGLAMFFAKSSAPASGGEHMLAHYMELMQPEADHSFHGEQIAVTTLTMAALQEKLLAGKDYIEISDLYEQKITGHFGKKFGEHCISQTMAKYKGLAGRKIKINKPQIEAVMLGAETIRAKLKAVGSPLAPNDLGWDEKIYDNAVNFARYTRDRFTFLDLV